MAHTVGRPGESRRRPPGPAADDHHQSLPVELLLLQPADDPVSDIQKDQPEGSGHHVIDRHRNLRRVDRVEEMSAQILEREARLIRQTASEEVQGHSAAVIDEIGDLALQTGPGFHGDRLAPVRFGIDRPHLDNLFHQTPCVRFPSGISKLAHAHDERDGDAEVRDAG